MVKVLLAGVESCLHVVVLASLVVGMVEVEVLLAGVEVLLHIVVLATLVEGPVEVEVCLILAELSGWRLRRTLVLKGGMVEVVALD